jgi:hypothetical protein
MGCACLQGGKTFHFNDHNDKNDNRGGIVKKLVLLAILALSAVFAFAQDAVQCLKVKVRPTVDGKTAEGVNIRLYLDNNEMLRVDSTDERYAVFVLERDKNYTIEVSKEGRFTRRVSISTRMPEELETGPLFKYVMDIELPPSVDLADDFYMDFPIAIISYNEDRDRFEHSKAYSANIKQRMEEHRTQTLVVKKE